MAVDASLVESGKAIRLRRKLVGVMWAVERNARVRLLGHASGTIVDRNGEKSKSANQQVGKSADILSDESDG